MGLGRRKERHLRVWSQLPAALSYSKDMISWVRCLRCGAQAGHKLVREGPRERLGELCHSGPCGAAELGAAGSQQGTRLMPAQGDFLSPFSWVYSLLPSLALPTPRLH